MPVLETVHNICFLSTILEVESEICTETVLNRTHVCIYFFALNDRYYDQPEY
jgi:hypothetical protein